MLKVKTKVIQTLRGLHDQSNILETDITDAFSL